MKEERLKLYQQYLEDLMKTFDRIEYMIIPRAQNQFTDALDTFAFRVEIPEEVWTWPLEIEQSYGMVHKEKAEASVLVIKEERIPWYYNIMKYLELGVYSDRSEERRVGKECLE